MSHANEPPTGPVVLATHRSGLAARLGRPIHRHLRVRWSTVLLAIAFLGLGAVYLLVPHARRVTYYVPAVPAPQAAAPTTTVGARRVTGEVPSTTSTTTAGGTGSSTTSTTSTTTAGGTGLSTTSSTQARSAATGTVKG